MRNKHIGLIGVILAVPAVAIVAGQLFWASWNRVRPVALTDLFQSHPADRLMIDADAVRQMDLVEPTLPRLVQPVTVDGVSVARAVGEVDYTMFGDRPAPPAPDLPLFRPAVRRPRPKPRPYRVAMTYLSGEHRYAVIDSKLYRQDARLPGGEHLAEIAVGGVRLESAGGQRWIAIEEGAQ